MRFENRRFITQDVMESIPLKRGTQGGRFYCVAKLKIVKQKVPRLQTVQIPSEYKENAQM